MRCSRWRGRQDQQQSSRSRAWAQGAVRGQPARRPLFRNASAATLPADRTERTMQYTTLGRTGLRVSVAGLGCGGFSKLGLGTGKSEDEAVSLIRQALELGVNLLDTAAVYGTEEV